MTKDEHTSLVDRAIAWLSRQWIEPELSRFIQEAIEATSCTGCGAPVMERDWCLECARVIEESGADEAVTFPAESVESAVAAPASELSGVTSSPSPGPIPSPAAVERRDDFEEALAGAKAALGVLGTGVLRDPPLVREGARAFPQPKKLTIETPAGIVDVSKLDDAK